MSSKLYNLEFLIKWTVPKGTHIDTLRKIGIDLEDTVSKVLSKKQYPVIAVEFWDNIHEEILKRRKELGLK